MRCTPVGGQRIEQGLIRLARNRRTGRLIRRSRVLLSDQVSLGRVEGVTVGGPLGVGRLTEHPQNQIDFQGQHCRCPRKALQDTVFRFAKWCPDDADEFGPPRKHVGMGDFGPPCKRSSQPWHVIRLGSHPYHPLAIAVDLGVHQSDHANRAATVQFPVTTGYHLLRRADDVSDPAERHPRR